MAAFPIVTPGWKFHDVAHKHFPEPILTQYYHEDTKIITQYVWLYYHPLE